MLARFMALAVCAAQVLAAQQGPVAEQASVSIPASIFARDALFPQAAQNPPPVVPEQPPKPAMANPPKPREHHFDWTDRPVALTVLGIGAAAIGAGIYLCATSNQTRNLPSGPVQERSAGRLGGGIGAIAGGITAWVLESLAF